MTSGAIALAAGFIGLVLGSKTPVPFVRLVLNLIGAFQIVMGGTLIFEALQ